MPRNDSLSYFFSEKLRLVLEVPQVLDDLAARIRTEHTAVGTALKQNLEHAMAAGDLLIEAKGQVPHGQWLPWLLDNCMISERTAQLYMRVAKNRAEIEKKQIRNDIADLTLSEAAALLVLSSDVRKLLNFAKQLEDIGDPEEIVKLCVENGVGVIVDSDYDPFAGRTEDEQRGSNSFILFLVTKCGWPMEDASEHVEWVLQRGEVGDVYGFRSPTEWLGEKGDKFRKEFGLKPLQIKTVENCKAFIEQHATLSMAELDQLAKQLRERDGKAFWTAKPQSQKGRKSLKPAAAA
jgi:hypothetical protein